MMTEKGLGLQAKCVVAIVKGDFCAGSILDEMSIRGDLKLHVSKFIYDAENDRYARVPNETATIVVYPDQYLGCFSEDGRIEMFSARIKETGSKSSSFFPMLKVGNRVRICFDALAEIGCIRSISCRNGGVQYAMAGYFDGYDFDEDPVEPLASVDLQEMIMQVMSESEEPEESGDPDGKKPESAEPSQPGRQPEEYEEPPAEEGVQPGEAGGSGGDGYEAGNISSEGLNDLLQKMGGDEPDSENGGDGGSEGSGAGDGESKPATKPDGGKRHF